jgi:hypothetical protein
MKGYGFDLAGHSAHVGCQDGLVLMYVDIAAATALFHAGEYDMVREDVGIILIVRIVNEADQLKVAPDLGHCLERFLDELAV